MSIRRQWAVSSLLGAAMMEPLIVVDKRARRFHAVSFSSAAKVIDGRSRRVTVDAVCGARGRLYGVRGMIGEEERAIMVPWPPRVAAIPDGWERCRECMAAAGVTRPRWPPAEGVTVEVI